MRQDLLPENNLEQTLTELEKVADELKGRQFVSGDSLQFSVSSTPATYDWSGLLPASPMSVGVGTKIITIYAEAENMEVLYGDIMVELYVAGARYTPAEYLAQVKVNVNAVYFRSNTYPLPLGIAQKNTIAGRVYITGDQTTTCAIKAYVTASDDVTITIVQEN